MAFNVSDYAIPWTGVDLTPGVSLLARSLQAKRADKRANMNAETQRMFADAGLRRINAQLARQVEQDKIEEEKRKYTREMDRAKFLREAPYLTRNPLLPAIGKSYGVDINEVDAPAATTTNPLLAAVMAPDVTPTVDAVSGDVPPPTPAVQTGENIFPSEDQGAYAQFDPGQEHTTIDPMSPANAFGVPLDQLTDEQRRIMAENVTSVADRTTLARPPEIPPERIIQGPAIDLNSPEGLDTGIMPAPEPSPPAAKRPITSVTPTATTAPMVASDSAPAPRNKLFRATIGGQSYDITPQNQTTGLGEKYDAIYNRLLQEPGGEKVAFAKVMALWDHEQTQIALGQRAKDAAGAKDTRQDDQQAFLREMAAKYKLTVEQLLEKFRLDRESRERAVRAASGQGPVSPELAQIIKDYQEGNLATRGDALAEAAKKKLPMKTTSGELGAVVREAGASERAQEKHRQLTATDENGKVIGEWDSPKSAADGRKQTEAFHRVEERFKALIAHVNQHGARVGLDTQEYQDRLSLGRAVAAALRPFNELSNTNAGQKLEDEILGAIGVPGHGWILGANISGLRHLLEEARGQHRVQLNTKLRPEGTSQLPPVLGGPRQAPGGSSAKPRKTRTMVGPNGETAVFDAETGERIQ